MTGIIQGPSCLVLDTFNVHTNSVVNTASKPFLSNSRNYYKNFHVLKQSWSFPVCNLD